MTKPSLSHDAEPEAYGQAMIMCQSYAPECSYAGECLFDGICFSSSGIGFAGARRSIQKLIDDQPDVYGRSWLLLALDALDHHQFMECGALDAMKVVAINKRVRREYNDPMAWRTA